MKKFIIVLVVLAIVIALISIHSYFAISLSNDIRELAENVYSELEENDWEDIREDIEEINKKWHARRLWFALTINSAKLDQIDTAIEQCTRFAKFEEKADFIDKISTLYSLVKQIPPQEGLKVENLF